MKGIYAYWDLENKYYVYIGKDSYIDKNLRHKAHLYSSKYEGQPFNRVLQKNPERYKYGLLMQGYYTDEQLNKMEQFLIKHLKTYRYDYPERNVFNFTKGGDGTSGYKHSEESKQKMSKSKEGMYNGENNPNYGVPHSDETINKIAIGASKSLNTSGYFRVYKCKDITCNQGFIWTYQYYEEGKRKKIRSVDIKKLENKVKAKNLEWFELNN